MLCRGISHVLMWDSGDREISAVDCEIKAPTAVALLWLGELEI